MIGNYYRVVPEFTKIQRINGEKGPNAGVRMAGRCIYEHPRERFMVLEFKFGNELIRECFSMKNRRA